MTMGNSFYDFLVMALGLLFLEWTVPVQVQNLSSKAFARGVSHSSFFNSAFRKTLPVRLILIFFLAVLFAVVNVFSKNTDTQVAVFVLVFVAYGAVMIAHMAIAEKFARQAVKAAAKDDDNKGLGSE
jgi:threonine/homoserine/homoserine lactone efflux protein